MNSDNIWSKVKHTFEKSIYGQDASFNILCVGTDLVVGGASNLKSINADSLNILNTTILNGIFSSG